MGRLLRGAGTLAEYLLLLRSLHAVYRALEEELDRRAHHPGVAPVRHPELYRTAALEADLEHLAGPGWQETAVLLPTAARYAAHLRRLGANRPGRLAAHVYVRTLGDLNGGRILRKIVARIPGMDPHGGGPTAPGLAFHRFPPEVEADPGRWIARVREGLDALAWPPGREHEPVLEARHGFRLHVRLFREVEGAA